jgi:hypothetical protein
MEIFLKLPYQEIPLGMRTLVFDNEFELNKIRRIPPMREDAEIRIVEYYLDKNRISYIVRDWTEGKKESLGTKCFFSKDL